MFRAGSWAMLGQVFGAVLRLASSLVMTRLLVPEVFGIVALAGVIHVIVTLLSDIGLRQAVIQSPRGHTPIMLHTAWALQAIRGVAIWLTCSAIAAGLYLARALGLVDLDSVYAAPVLPAVVVVSTLGAVILGFQSTKSMIADRNLDQRRIVLIEVASQLAGVVVMVACAWWFRSVWSIVAGGLASAVVTVTLSHVWLSGAPDRLGWDRDAAKELLGYGRWVLASYILYVMSTNADRLLLGAWVSAATLGIYALALNLATLLEILGARLFSSVAMPALSEVARSDRERFRHVYFRMRLPFDAIFLAAAGFVFAVGELLVAVLYDPRYAQAGEMLQVLSFLLVFSRYGLAGSAYLALGVPRNLTIIHVVKLVAVVVLIPVGYALGGVQGAIWGIALHALVALPVTFYLNHKLGLNSARFELGVLAAWPVGWLIGLSTVWVAGHLPLRLLIER
jgi:O-antigen/teichoic acid export membrane protein